QLAHTWRSTGLRTPSRTTQPFENIPAEIDEVLNRLPCRASGSTYHPCVHGGGSGRCYEALPLVAERFAHPLRRQLDFAQLERRGPAGSRGPNTLLHRPSNCAPALRRRHVARPV